MPSPAMHPRPLPETRKKPPMILAETLITFSAMITTACIAVGIFEHDWITAAVGLTGLLINVILWKYTHPTNPPRKKHHERF